MATATTDPRHAEAREMREGGATLREVAEKFGVSKSTIVRWTDPEYAERSRADCRARKLLYRGECKSCGAPTDGSNGPGKARPYCAACAPDAYRKWTRDEVIRAIQSFNACHGRQPTAGDFAPALARRRRSPDRVAAAERNHDYPLPATVISLFGSWNEGIRAAGFQPYGVGQYPRDASDGRRGAHLTGAWTIEDAA